MECEETVAQGEIAAVITTNLGINNFYLLGYLIRAINRARFQGFINSYLATQPQVLRIRRSSKHTKNATVYKLGLKCPAVPGKVPCLYLFQALSTSANAS